MAEVYIQQIDRSIDTAGLTFVIPGFYPLVIENNLKTVLKNSFRSIRTGSLFSFATFTLLFLVFNVAALAQTIQFDSNGRAMANRREWAAVPSLSVSSQDAANPSGAPPRTFNEWQAQNAANEKSNHSVETAGIVLVAVVVALALFRRWFLRR